MDGTTSSLLDQTWAAIAAAGDGAPPGPPAPLAVTGPAGHLPSRHRVEEAAVACAGAALLAASALGRQRGGPAPDVALERGNVAAAVRSERFFRLGDRPRSRLAAAGFAPLSRFWRAADGWVRTHGNYPWHRAALLRALACSDHADAVAAAIAEMPAHDVEERVFAEGGVAAAVRSPEAWRAHPQGESLAAAPLVAHRALGPAPARVREAADLPMRGVRVLDLTRVIAGPVCTRFLAALGADVLRLDPPDHPDMPPGAAADTLLGKRSALLDLAAADGLDAAHRLLDGADVAVLGYRPGALDRFGLGADRLAERHPGLVAVYLDAWGWSGPWSGRRGFDSVVQAASGIAAAESGGAEEPGALPCQLLDHGTGYLAAAAAVDAVRRQIVLGGTHARYLSLARTAWWLRAAGPSELAAPPAPDEGSWTIDVAAAGGPATVVAPPGRLADRPLAWPAPLTGYGADPPAWPERSGYR